MQQGWPVSTLWWLEPKVGWNSWIWLIWFDWSHLFRTLILAVIWVPQCFSSRAGMFKVFTDLSLPGLRWLKQLELPRQIYPSTRRLAWAASHCGGLRVVNFSEILWLTFPRVGIPRDQTGKWKASSDLVLKVTPCHFGCNLLLTVESQSHPGFNRQGMAAPVNTGRWSKVGGKGAFLRN